jgi:hypothetical protein
MWCATFCGYGQKIIVLNPRFEVLGTEDCGIAAYLGRAVFAF